MNQKEVLSLQSMPAASGSYGRPPCRFINREFFIITYESDPAAIRQAVPEPLQPDGSNTVSYEWIKMPDSSGLGSYEESGIVIPCTFHGEPCNFVAQMYLDNAPAILGGREIWGFPKKWAKPRLIVEETETLTGTLHYNNVLVATGTMPFKYNILDEKETAKAIAKTQVNLKLIPDVDGTPKIAQLVAYNLENITVKGAWSGPARLSLIPHVNAPVADLPVKAYIGGKHFIADLTLPYGRVLYDYLQ
ncbi:MULTISPECIES: acetoacetate decarboxylase [Paenibacillus]|jgi:acetoacetate decarboxylase|uniref:Acetoacetate decarboxylase n=2 Tax=Paenibacillus TaxID=44249 RepID=A0ABX2ZH64_PAEPO|nr:MULTISPECIES: acetoacetate decarboxylase [Paenibacillus]APQ58415.1 acetoacetate decarboxylase [Paenibacillus polymyxa]MDR6777597.1 acetoacetate decarboxylase [Paenibacillus peoriae]ODA10559.1 acetoacetate decarboxylase [Paenibacillus polymyxa]ODB58035.1 acetoacetate decarboxylase [Paenibacillus polymyxa]OME70143.1 acetoacetate decarboxylase [Paenibacillus peoriae]